MIPLFKVLMSEEAPRRVAEVLRSGHVAQGPQVDAFEAALHGPLGLGQGQEILAVSSGTAALDLALHLCGVGPGDEVVTTAMTCTATNQHVVHRGARPVWADVDRVTGLISPASVAEKITERTKAIVAVDWGGVPCDYDELRRVAKTSARDGWRSPIPIIEDAAHAFLATYKGRPLAQGGGDLICWSLQAIKTLTTGDGGLLLAPHGYQAERARLLRWFGLDRRSTANFRCSQDIRELGFKYHLNDIAAAIGLANLPLAVEAVKKHRANVRDLHLRLSSLQIYKGRIALPPCNPEASWWVYTILVEDRPSFEAAMADAGIQVSQVHARNDRHTAFRAAAGEQGPLPGLDWFSAREIAIPCGWWLSDSDIDHIVGAVTSWVTSER